MAKAGRARAHAEAAVALVPGVAVPEGAPAEVGAMVDEARERLGGEAARLRLRADPPGEDGGTRRVRARLAPAPGALALALALRCVPRGMSPSETRGAAPEVEVTVPADRPVRCQAAARTASGATLFEAQRELAPARVLAPAPGPGDGGGSSAWIWVGVGAGAVLVAGIAVALLASASGSAPVISATEIDADGW